MQKITIALLLLIVSVASAADNFSGKDEVNGISYNDYKDFPKKWQLVTIRFRKDTGEIRITYANDLAMKTLASGSINYPDGAAFAKTNVLTNLDEQYPNSVAPKEISRYQFMIRNSSKYASTNGWGYAIFDPNGKTFPEEPVKMSNACYSCHLAVENRGDVFSRPFSFLDKVQMPTYTPAAHAYFTYIWMDVKKLPAIVQTNLPKNIKKIRMLNNQKLMDNAFQGTLDELRPLLQDETSLSKAPALFMASDKIRFVMVIPNKNNKCTDFLAYKIIATDLNFKTVETISCKYDQI